MGRMDRGKQLVDAAKAAGPKAREIGRAAASLDIPWARCGPARAVRETIQSLHPRAGDRPLRAAQGEGQRALRAPQAAGDHGGQPRQPPRHADHPARAAARLAPAHGGRRGGRLLLPQPPRRDRACRCCSTRCPCHAAAAAWSRARRTTSTDSSTSAGTSCCTRRARARAAASVGKLRSGAAVLAARARHRDRAHARLRHARRDAARAAPGRAAPGRSGCADIRSRSASVGRSTRMRTVTSSWPSWRPSSPSRRRPTSPALLQPGVRPPSGR